MLEKHERWTASGAMSCPTSKKTARRLERTEVMSSLSQLPLQLSLPSPLLPLSLCLLLPLPNDAHNVTNMCVPGETQTRLLMPR